MHIASYTCLMKSTTLSSMDFGRNILGSPCGLSIYYSDRSCLLSFYRKTLESIDILRHHWN